MSYDVQHWCTVSSTNRRGHSLFILVCSSTVRTKHFLWMWDGVGFGLSTFDSLSVDMPLKHICSVSVYFLEFAKSMIKLGFLEV